MCSISLLQDEAASLLISLKSQFFHFAWKATDRRNNFKLNTTCVTTDVNKMKLNKTLHQDKKREH